MAPRVRDVRFVGREAELTRFARALEAASAGRTTTVIVTGTAGIGASRLVGESERRLADLPVEFTVIRCGRSAVSWGEPYAPVIAGFGPLLASLPDDELARVVGPGLEPIGRLFPEVLDRLGRLGRASSRTWVVPPERRQPRLLEALLGTLERMGERAPVLLAIEDLHAADAGTRALVTFLARVTRPSRLCLVATYQPDEMTRRHPLRADLASIDESIRPRETIGLGPLSRDELADLIAAVEGERPSGATLLLVAERSGGNPLVAEEILAARRELSGVNVAGSFEQLVTARLAQRSPECREVLQLLAVAGASLTVADLATAAAHQRQAPGVTVETVEPGAAGTSSRDLDDDLADGLAEAIDHGFLMASSGQWRTHRDATLWLRHELIAGAIASDLLPARRAAVTAALGAVLVDRPGARARHLLATHNLPAARAAALAAADMAAARDAPADELAALELAISLDLPGRGAEGRRSQARLLARAAEAASSADQTGRAVAFTEAAIGGLMERTDRYELALLYDRLGRYRRVIGDQAGFVDAHRHAVRLIPRGATRERAQVLAALAQALMLEGSFAAAEQSAREAIQVASAVGDAARAEEGHAMCTLGILEAWGGKPEAAPALLEGARVIAESLGRIDDLFRASANATTALTLLGCSDDAIAAAEQGIELAREAGLDAVYGNFLRGNVAIILFMVGRWEEARSMSRTALEWSPSGPVVLDAEAALATVEIETAADEAAARRLGRLLLALETRPDPQDVGPASRAAASFALWRRDLVDARRTAELGWSQATSTEDWYLIGLMAATMLDVLSAVVADARERRDLAAMASARTRAAEVFSEVEGVLRGIASRPAAGSRRWAEASLATARAFRARLDGRDEPSAWDLVARMWEGVGDPYQVAKARWHQAQAALANGRDARDGRRLARGPLREAVRIARQLDANPLLRELAELAERAMITLPAQPEGETPTLPSVDPATATVSDSSVIPDGLAVAFIGAPTPRGNTFGLSVREREVLMLLAQGKTNREIGERLFISQKTVGVHVGNVLAKMRVAGRVEAATVAIRLGLTNPS